MSLHIVAPFSLPLISPLPHGSTHFLQSHSEWRRTPKFLPATAYNPLSLHLSLKAQCPVPVLLLCSSQRRRWKTSLAAKHQSSCKVWLSHTWSPHTVHHPADASVQENVSTSTCLQLLTLPVANCAQLVSFQRGIQFAALMMPAVPNPVITMTSEKRVPS